MTDNINQFIDLNKSRCLTLITFNVLANIFIERWEKESNGVKWENKSGFGLFLAKNHPKYKSMDKDDKKVILNGTISTWCPEILVDLLINYGFKNVGQNSMVEENKIISKFTPLLLEYVTKFNDRKDYKSVGSEIINQLQSLLKYSNGFYSSDKINFILNSTSNNGDKDYTEQLLKYHESETQANEILKLGNQLLEKGDYKGAIRVYEKIGKLYEDNQNQISMFIYSVILLKSSQCWTICYLDDNGAFPEYVKYAETDITKSIKRRPSNSDGWLIKGCVLILMGNYQEAAMNLKITMELDGFGKFKSLISNLLLAITPNKPIDHSNIRTIIRKIIVTLSNVVLTVAKLPKNGTWARELLEEILNDSSPMLCGFNYKTLNEIKGSSNQAKSLIKTNELATSFFSLFTSDDYDGSILIDNMPMDEMFQKLSSPDSSTYELKILSKIIDFSNSFTIDFYSIRIPFTKRNTIVEFLKRHIELFPNCQESRLSLLGVYYLGGLQLLENLEFIGTCIKLFPDQSQFKFYRSLCSIYKDKFSIALMDLDKCVSSEPSNLKYLFYYIHLLYFTFSFQKSKSEILKFIKLSPIDGWKLPELCFLLTYISLYCDSKRNVDQLYANALKSESLQLDSLKEYSQNQNSWKNILLKHYSPSL